MEHKFNTMNKLQNAVNLIGRAGINPIVRTFENGVKLAKFSLATNETITEVNGKRHETQWHNVVAWGKKAELIEKFVKKGQLMVVDGKLINRVFKGNDGSSKRMTEIQVNEILLINKKKKLEDQPTPTPAQIKEIKKNQVKQLSAQNHAERESIKKAS
jgi:single-strand DNA-binding protein